MVQYKWYAVNRPLVNGQYGPGPYTIGQYWSKPNGRPVYQFLNRHALRANECVAEEIAMTRAPRDTRGFPPQLVTLA